jgi:hypothetical protein
MLALHSRFMTPEDLQGLEELAAERDALYAKDYDQAAVRGLGSRVFRFCRERRIPVPLRYALGRCL